MIRVLSLHADYGCRRSGACCTAGWPIAIEPRVEQTLAEALRRGTLRLPVAAAFVSSAGKDAPPTLALDERGRCVFFEEGRPHACAIHRRLGQASLPLACRQFPRVSLLAPDGVSVTLSHFCPTAAGMLFRHDVDLRIVADPPAFPPEGEYEGLDARDSLPLLRPGVFLDWEGHRLWERHAVKTLAREDLPPERALARLERDARAAAGWQLRDGMVNDHVARITAAPDTHPAETPTSFADAVRAWRCAASCVPAEVRLPAAPDAGLAAADEHWVVPVWRTHARTVRRYLAAKAFASWCAVQGDGLITAVAFLSLALGTLRVEAARAAAAGQRPLDAAALKQAIRACDLLLVHLAAPEALARALGRRLTR